MKFRAAKTDAVFQSDRMHAFAIFHTRRDLCEQNIIISERRIPNPNIL